MAKEKLLTILCWLSISPLIFFSELSYIFNWRGLKRDVHIVVSMVDKMSSQVPEEFSSILFLAEDHRSRFHPGVDSIALMRAVWVRLRWWRREGGSTVEQQLVRTVLCRYERNFSRKLQEQLLALAVARRRAKQCIATAYLAVAYYGTRYVGVDGLKKLCGNNLDAASSYTIYGAIARLKYPEPAQLSANWSTKLRRRVEYIAQRQARLAHSSGRSYRAGA